MIQVMVSLHEEMIATVTSSGQCSEAFSISNGTKENCVLASIRFAIFFSLVFQHAFKDYHGKVNFHFHTDSNLLILNGQNFRSKTKINKGNLNDFFFCLLTTVL